MTRQASTTSLASAGRSVIESGDAAQRDELLDRLMRRAILAHADRVVREDVDDRQLHQRAQPNRRLHVIGEDEEARAVSANLGQRQPVQDRAHGMLANAEMKIAAARGVSFQIARSLECEACLGRRSEVGRAADKPGVVRGDSVQNLAGGVAASNTFRVGREDWADPRPSLREVRASAYARADRRVRDTSPGRISNSVIQPS